MMPQNFETFTNIVNSSPVLTERFSALVQDTISAAREQHGVDLSIEDCTSIAELRNATLGATLDRDELDRQLQELPKLSDSKLRGANPPAGWAARWPRRSRRSTLARMECAMNAVAMTARVVFQWRESLESQRQRLCRMTSDPVLKRLSFCNRLRIQRRGWRWQESGGCYEQRKLSRFNHK
jgi:hypothetical protein